MYFSTVPTNDMKTKSQTISCVCVRGCIVCMALVPANDLWDSYQDEYDIEQFLWDKPACVF